MAQVFLTVKYDLTSVMSTAGSEGTGGQAATISEQTAAGQATLVTGTNVIGPDGQPTQNTNPMSSNMLRGRHMTWVRWCAEKDNANSPGELKMIIEGMGDPPPAPRELKQIGGGSGGPFPPYHIDNVSVERTQKENVEREHSSTGLLRTVTVWP